MLRPERSRKIIPLLLGAQTPPSRRHPANTERSTNVRFWFSRGSFSTNRLGTFLERSQNVDLSYVTGSFFVLFWFVPNEPSGNVPRTLVSHMGLGSFFVLFWFVPNEPSGNVPRTLVSHIWDLVRFSFSFGSIPANLLGTFPERSSVTEKITTVKLCNLNTSISKLKSCWYNPKTIAY